MSTLARFVVLYAVLYAAFGVASPFVPAFLHSRGISAGALGLVLAAGTVARLASAPLAGRLGDRIRGLRLVLTASASLAALVTAAYLSVRPPVLLALLYVAQSAALAPTSVLADALAVGRGFEYGWVRGAGSAAFVAGTLLSGQAVAALGLVAIVGLQSALLGAAALAARRVPERTDVLEKESRQSSLLWSEAVASEVLVFFVAGPALVARLTPGGAIVVASLAGALRWGVMASSASVLAAALVQPLHGITFALLHLACMRLIARTVPPGLEGTAQAIYGTIGVGAASALLTLASGVLYGRFGAPAFWAMAALCAAALPVALTLVRSSAQ